MTIFEQELVANRSALSRFFAAVVAITRATGRSLARSMRIRRDRAGLDELPDYLLHDIGVGRAEIRWITRYGRAENGK